MCGRYEQHLPAVHGWTQVLDAWPTERVARQSQCSSGSKRGQRLVLDLESFRMRLRSDAHIPILSTYSPLRVRL